MGELIAELEEYSIYKVKNEVAGYYYLCIPSGNVVNYANTFGCQIFLGFNDKDVDKITDDDIVSMIRDVNDKIWRIDKNSVYIVPEIQVDSLNELADINDTKDYMKFVNKKIHPIIYEVYELLLKNGIKKEHIGQNIMIITKNYVDEKIAGGLSLCPEIGTFIHEMKYEKLQLLCDSREQNPVDDLSNEVPTEGDKEIKVVFDSGIVPINREHEDVDTDDKSNENRLVRTRKPTDTSPGFSSFKFILATLLFSLVVGVSIGYLIMR